MFCNVHKSVFSFFLLKLVYLDCKNTSFFSVRLLPLVAEEGAAVGRSQSVDMMCFFHWSAVPYIFQGQLISWYPLASFPGVLWSWKLRDSIAARWQKIMTRIEYIYIYNIIYNIKMNSMHYYSDDSVPDTHDVLLVTACGMKEFLNLFLAAGLNQPAREGPLLPVQ